ncbi:MAG: DUF1320 domain-containing protein [Victivallaceae bacterium]|nr:DUF1320 domain-containing protein [Victivallaceae bacterium]
MYATVTDLQLKLGSRFASIYPGGDTDPGAIADTTAASAEIDGYLAGRYTVPVTQAGALELLKSWALALAESLSYERAAGSKLPEKVIKRAEQVRRTLRDTAAGTFQLPAAPAESTTGAGSAAMVAAATPVFTRDKMTGF